MAVTPLRTSLAEFLQQPEVKPARELRRGTVSQKGASTGPQSAIAGWLARELCRFTEPGELGRVFLTVRLLLGEDTYVPDLVMYRWDRIPADEHGNLPTYFQRPPDLAVEIVSPRQTLAKQLERCHELVNHGVRAAVLVHPGQQTVYVVRADGEEGPLHADAALDLDDVLTGLRLPIADLFGQLRARPPRP